MAQKNTILKKYNGTSYDNIYPTTKASNVKCTNPFTQEASNLQDTIDYMVEVKYPHFILYDYESEYGNQESYSFDIGMTWGEWVNSSYNTTSSSSLVTGGKLEVVYDNEIGWDISIGHCRILFNSNLVHSTDLIQLSARYKADVVY